MTIITQGAGTATCIALTGGAAAPVSLANEAKIRYNTAAHQAELSQDGGPYTPFFGSTGTMLTVASAAALAAVDEGPLVDGTIAAMLSLMCAWQLNKTSTDVADGITVIATLSGVGRWHRVPGGSEHWRRQTSWKVDQNPGAGNDENVGSPAFPLATWNEFRRRHGSVLGAGGTVTVVLDGPAGVFANDIVVDMEIAYAEQLLIMGTRTVLYSGSVTGYQAWNPGATRPCEITDVALPVSWAASGLVDHEIVLTSGAHSGYASFAVYEPLITLKTCRTHFFVDAVTLASAEAAPAETFDVCSCTNTTGDIYVKTNERGGVVRFVDLYILYLAISGSIVEIANCKVTSCGGTAGNVGWFGGMLTNTFQTGGGEVATTSHTISKAARWLVECGGRLKVQGEALNQTDCYFDARSGSVLEFAIGGDSAFFDCKTRPVRIAQSAFCNVESLLWGTTNTSDYAIVVDADGCLSCNTSTPAISGAVTADTSIGGTAKTFAEAAAGFVHATNLARAVVSL